MIAVIVLKKTLQPDFAPSAKSGMAIAMASGPDAGLELVDELVASGALDGYHLLPAVRGHMLERLGRNDEARAEFELAASLTRNARERGVLLGRAGKLS